MTWLRGHGKALALNWTV